MCGCMQLSVGDGESDEWVCCDLCDRWCHSWCTNASVADVAADHFMYIACKCLLITK